MNTVTKVFIIINLFLAACIMYVVPVNYAYQENWKRRWDKDTRALAADLELRDKQVLEQTFKRTEMEINLRTAETQLSDLEIDVKEKESSIADLERQKAILTNQISELNVTLNAQREENQSLRASLQLERKRRSELNHIAQVARAVAFELNVKLAEVEDDLNNAQAELTRRERAIFDLEQEMKRKNSYLALVRDNYPEVYREITATGPQGESVIRAVVAAVRRNPQGQQDLVMLTVGDTEGVQEGMEFILYRENSYVVKVRAERVMGDMVACRVIVDTWNGRGDEIQQGDLAQNRLF